jgi:hypothetical protein
VSTFVHQSSTVENCEISGSHGGEKVVCSQIDVDHDDDVNIYLTTRQYIPEDSKLQQKIIYLECPGLDLFWINISGVYISKIQKSTIIGKKDVSTHKIW